MSVDRQQMLETAERLNQQMADGIPYTWETLEQALSFVTEKRDRGIHGRICYFAAFYHLDTGNQEQCLKYLDESVRCLLGTDQEIHVARAYNMIGIVAHMQNNLSLAMEQYGRALDYTAKYNDKMVHSIVLSNMADAYYLIGVYDRAVQCYRECIREFEKAGDDSIYSRINFRKMLSEYGCCLLHLDMEQEAMEVCHKLEETGKAKITKGYNLPAKHVIHTVGPIVGMQVTEKQEEELKSCYLNCMKLAEKEGLKSIAFCCISTGEFHFPNKLAAEIAVKTVDKYLSSSKLERVIFNVFKEEDYNIYKKIFA